MLTVRSTINIASQTVPPIIPVVQGDTGRAILFTLADFTIPAGATATYYVQKPSGEAVYNNATIDGNNVLVELTAQSIIEKGDNYGQVRITVGEEVVTSFDFILLVKEFRGIDAVQSLTEMNIFDKAVEQASEAIDEVKTDALEAIDDAKDEAIEEVTSNFDLKLDASSTKGVQNQVITQAINTVNNAIGDLSGETVTPTATNNYGVGGNVGQVIETWATTEYWHGIYTVSAGNTYGITTVSDFPQQIVVWFTNSSNVILEIHKAFATDHVEMVCTAPTGATKLFVMSYGYDAYHGTVQKVEPLSETVSNLKDDFDSLETALETKANIDGSYDNMTVGNAKQLVATVGITDKVPYNFRTSGGSADIGDREVDKIVGGTVVWNQHSDNSRQTTTLNGITFTNNGDGSITVNGTADATTTFNSIEHTGDNAIYGHIYLIAGCPSGFSGCYLQDPMSAGSQNADYGSGRVIKRTSESTRLLTQIYVQGNATITNAVFKPQLIDLTQMFGSTIADYIYGLEQSQAGAGVAWFRKLFPKPYYAYNAGSLQSVQTSEHKMVGFNQWDEEWLNGYHNPSTGVFVSNANYICSKNLIRVLPSTTYYFNTNGEPWEINEYDASGNYLRQLRSNIVDSTFVPDADTHFIHIGSHNQTTTYNNDICINLSWDGERNGEYEAYKEYTYPLDDSLTLRGIPKLDSGNNLYYDGDVYEADGTVTRRYAELLADGSFDVISVSLHSSGLYYTVVTNSLVAPASNPLPISDRFLSVMSVGIGNCYITSLGSVLVAVLPDQTITTKEAATQWFAQNPTRFVYELATPTTESADPFTNPQIVDDFGTEEYVDAGVTASTPTRDVAIPVGHETVYQANLRAKLEMAPNSPDGDGDYIVRQTNGENEYVLLEEELPSAPSSDGIYVLKATVASGTATLTWVEET